MAKILASDINDWRTRLNAIRKKYGLSAYSFTSINGDNKILASDFNDIKAKMEQTTRDAAYVADKTFDIGTVASGSLIKDTTRIKINESLTVLEGLCNNCANYGNYSDYSNYSNYSSDYASNNSNYGVNQNDCSGEAAGACN